LPPTSKDSEIRDLLNETFVNFGQMVRIAEGLITHNISDPAKRAGALKIVRRAVEYKEFLGRNFVEDELTLADPSEFIGIGGFDGSRDKRLGDLGGIG